MVTVECSSSTTVNTSDSFTCACKGKGGKPPANVTWYIGNDVKSITGKEEKILHVFSAKRDDSGTYRCEAKSHEVAKNDTEIELIVNCKYIAGTIMNQASQ